MSTDPVTAFNWDGDLTLLADEELEKRLVALSRYLAAGLVLRERDMRVREEGERAAPTVLWKQAHDEVARRIALESGGLVETGGRRATPDEIEAWFGTIPTDQDQYK